MNVFQSTVGIIFKLIKINILIQKVYQYYLIAFQKDTVDSNAISIMNFK
jgi:hypothetical protein